MGMEIFNGKRRMEEKAVMLHTLYSKLVMVDI